jgi:(p)ppGpp synthase/HD superfamily hydrolase
LDFYHGRFITAPVEAILIKLADRLHNQLTLWCCIEEKIRRKMKETIDIYIPLAKRVGILVHELIATTEDFEERLIEHMKSCPAPG